MTHICKPSPVRIQHRLNASDVASFAFSASFCIAGMSTDPTSVMRTTCPSISVVSVASIPTIPDSRAGNVLLLPSCSGTGAQIGLSASKLNGPTMDSARWLMIECPM